MTLNDIDDDMVVTITQLPLDELLATRLLEQGFSLGTAVSVAHKAPFDGPIAIRLHNTKLSIPRSIAEHINVK